MLLITKIETIETPKSMTEIQRMIYCDYPGDEYVPLDGQPVNVKVLKETIKGRRFRHPKREIDVIIGMTNQVAEFLGLEFEAWEELDKTKRFWQEQHNEALIKREAITNQIREMESWGLWKRIKCVFTGIKRPEQKGIK